MSDDNKLAEVDKAEEQVKSEAAAESEAREQRDTAGTQSGETAAAEPRPEPGADSAAQPERRGVAGDAAGMPPQRLERPLASQLSPVQIADAPAQSHSANMATIQDTAPRPQSSPYWSGGMAGSVGELAPVPVGPNPEDKPADAPANPAETQAMEHAADSFEGYPAEYRGAHRFNSQDDAERAFDELERRVSRLESSFRRLAMH